MAEVTKTSIRKISQIWNKWQKKDLDETNTKRARMEKL